MNNNYRIKLHGAEEYYDLDGIKDNARIMLCVYFVVIHAVLIKCSIESGWHDVQIWMIPIGIATCFSEFLVVSFCMGEIYGMRRHLFVNLRAVILGLILFTAGVLLIRNEKIEAFATGYCVLEIGISLLISVVLGELNSCIEILRYSDAAWAERIREQTKKLVAEKGNKKPKNDKKPFERTRIVNKRKALGLSQGDVARLIGVNVNTICSVERKENYDPRLSLVRGLCAVLDDTVENLFWADSD